MTTFEDSFLNILESIDEKLGRIAQALESTPSIPQSTSAGLSQNELKTAVLALVKTQPDRWWQPKDIAELGIDATNQKIASILKGAVSRGEMKAELKSIVTKKPLENPDRDYDPTLYQWK